jgi:hypothetical protein
VWRARAAGRVRGWEDRRAVRCASASAAAAVSLGESKLEDEWDEGESGPSIGGGTFPPGNIGCA